MTIDRGTLYQLFKYTVYALLALNVILFLIDEYRAATLQFPEGLGPGDVIAAYAATIDTAAWLVLLLMFELETYVLHDRHFTAPVTLSLHGVRVLSYAFIAYAFYGYVAKLIFLDAAVPLADVSDLCGLAGDWSYAVGLEDYAAITPANCGGLSPATAFLQFGDLQAVVDTSGFTELRRLAWVDVINAAVWILVVVVLEVDVRLQDFCG